MSTPFAELSFETVSIPIQRYAATIMLTPAEAAHTFQVSGAADRCLVEIALQLGIHLDHLKDVAKIHLRWHHKPVRYTCYWNRIPYAFTWLPERIGLEVGVVATVYEHPEKGWQPAPPSLGGYVSIARMKNPPLPW